MKISELSRLSGVNAETIRMYRNRGLLSPARDEGNGYYSYSLEDFMNLLYIRKLRSSGVSLETVGRLNSAGHLEDIIDSYGKEIHNIEETIRQLLHQKDLLELTKRHLEGSREGGGEIKEIESPDSKYDCYCLDDAENPGVGEWLRHMEMFTPTLRILRDDLSKKALPPEIPVQAGIGTYLHVLEGCSLKIPKKTVILPKGRFLTVTVKLKQLTSLPGSQLKPLLDYAQGHDLEFDSDTTAFLIRVDSAGTDRTFAYRLRVKVKERR